MQFLKNIYNFFTQNDQNDQNNENNQNNENQQNQNQQEKQKQEISIPISNIKILNILCSYEKEEIIEIGYSIITHNENKNNGHYTLQRSNRSKNSKKKKEIFQCKPKQMKDDLKYFTDPKNTQHLNELDDCIEYIIQNVMKAQKFDLILYNSKSVKELFLKKDPSLENWTKGIPMCSRIEFFEIVYQQKTQRDPMMFPLLYESLIETFDNQNKGFQVCHYHKECKKEKLCSHRTAVRFVYQLNYLLDNPINDPEKKEEIKKPQKKVKKEKKEKIVNLYNEKMFQTMKEWIHNVPVYFMTSEPGPRFVLLMKQNIYNCSTIERKEWNLNMKNKQKDQINENNKLIGNYLKSKNEKAIIVVHHTEYKHVKTIRRMLFKFVDMPQTIVFTLDEFMNVLSQIHNVNFDMNQFNEKITKLVLENPQKPCDFHKNKNYHKCSYNLLLSWSTVVQMTMKENQIKLTNDDKMLRMKEQWKFNPNGKTFMYVNMTKEQDEIVEIGCVLFKHNNNSNQISLTNQFEIISDPQSFHCKPKKQKQGLEQFMNAEEIEVIIEYIYNNFFININNTFDYVIYSNGILKKYFSKYDMTKWMDKSIDDLRRKIVEMKLHIKVKDTYEQNNFVWKKIKPKASYICELHKRNKNKCVCAKLENDILLLNYFNENLFEIHSECPFIVNTMKQSRRNRKMNNSQNVSMKNELNVQKSMQLPVLKPLVEIIDETDESSHLETTETSEEIETTEEFTETSEESSNNFEGMLCSKCVNFSKNIKMFRCGHAICENCYDEWFVRHSQTICPNCHSHITERDVFKLFF